MTKSFWHGFYSDADDLLADLCTLYIQTKDTRVLQGMSKTLIAIDDARLLFQDDKNNCLGELVSDWAKIIIDLYKGE